MGQSPDGDSLLPPDSLEARRDEVFRGAMLGTQRLLRDGNVEGAAELCRSAMRVRPNDPTIRNACEQVLAQAPREPHFSLLLAECHEADKQEEQADRIYRDVVAPVGHRPASQVAATIAAARLAGREECTNPLIVVAAAPKSGSTFLTDALALACKLPSLRLVFMYEDNEQDLYLPALVDAMRFGGVSQQHMRASSPNVRLCREFGIEPVVLVRNLFDTVVSIRDHLRKEHAFGPVLQRFDRRYFELDETTRVDFIIDVALPWYFQFYAAWMNVDAQRLVPVHWQRYEDMIADKPGTLKRLAKTFGYVLSDEQIAAAIGEKESDRDRVRINKGVAGRGESELSEAQKQRIRDYARYYPWVDFSRLGL